MARKNARAMRTRVFPQLKAFIRFPFRDGIGSNSASHARTYVGFKFRASRREAQRGQLTNCETLQLGNKREGLCGRTVQFTHQDCEMWVMGSASARLSDENPFAFGASHNTRSDFIGRMNQFLQSRLCVIFQACSCIRKSH